MEDYLLKERVQALEREVKVLTMAHRRCVEAIRGIVDAPLSVATLQRLLDLAREYGPFGLHGMGRTGYENPLKTQSHDELDGQSDGERSDEDARPMRT